MPLGRQKAASQNGIEHIITGMVASATSTPTTRCAKAAAATLAAMPPPTQAATRAESLPTTFSSYSLMSLCT
mgnify:CR=1 FL=1